MRENEARAPQASVWGGRIRAKRGWRRGVIWPSHRRLLDWWEGSRRDVWRWSRVGCHELLDSFLNVVKLEASAFEHVLPPEREEKGEVRLVDDLRCCCAVVGGGGARDRGRDSGAVGRDGEELVPASV